MCARASERAFGRARAAAPVIPVRGGHRSPCALTAVPDAFVAGLAARQERRLGP